MRALLDGPYVTVHHGADRNMAGADGLQTKNLPLAKWLDIVARVKAAGLRTVQLGEAHEQLIGGVDADLRGKCTMSQSAMVLRHAQVHIDTEGGLVHLARAVGTPSVVAFGPTSLPFFGYPENTNLAAQTCGDCWWTSRDWSVRCPRELPTVACMESHSADSLAEAAIELSAPTTHLNFVSRRQLPGPNIVADLGRLLPSNGQGAVVGNDAETIAQLSEQGLSREEARLFALGDGFHHASAGVRLYPASWTRLPLDSKAIDWVVCNLSDDGGQLEEAQVASLLFECARVVKRGQILLALELKNRVMSLAELDTAFHASIGKRLQVSLSGMPDMLGAGVYEFTVESGTLTMNSGNMRNVMRKGLRRFDALASDVISRFSGASNGGQRD